ncbi:AI-2E family transporter [Acidiphilium sp. AL]|uniref:AI-2E family transporter n=1 Tax=Acidiphilium iwatense TaxID=768198 RepID=A0ABS9DVJ2_9PROT|nr:AI-2E family transporter [Acidiphilium sp. AL]MCF3946756.1 AI-2E family transporter [Acidiphilium iwatense]MCU4158725.1 AI-2E family transporter [Acidiphilium sp. AL]
MRETRSTGRLRPVIPVPAPGIPGVHGLTTLVASVVVVAALYLGREVLIPITLAVLLSFLVAPIVHVLRSWHLGRIPAVLVTMILLLGVLAGLGAVIGTQVAGLVQNIPQERAALVHKVETLRTMTVGNLGRLVKGAGDELKRDTLARPKKQTAAPAQPPPLRVRVVHRPISGTQLARRIVLPTLGPLALVFLVFTVAGFVLVYQDDLRDRLIRLFGSHDLHRTTTALDDAAHRLSRYFLAKFLINLGSGVVVGVGLAVIGVPGAILWGVVTMLARFVPYIGSVIAAVPPALLAAAIAPGWSMVIWTLVLFIVTEAIAGQVVEPMAYGHSTGLSPISVLVAAIFWSFIWGPIGLLLSTPLTLCGVVLGQHFKRLEFFAVIFGNQPALTAVESFYQRALAGDPDDVADQAEIVLRDRLLGEYYDEVVLPALRFAAADADRGVLYPGQIERVEATIHELMTVLDERDEIAAMLHRVDFASPSVLCFAGRGRLDELAASLLTQLLRWRGIGARVVSFDAVSRSQIAALDTTGIEVGAICTLDAGTAPSSLRYLVRRVHGAMPGASLAVGFWTTSEDYERYARFQAAIDAEWFPTSLRDAVGIVMEFLGRSEEDAPEATIDPAPVTPETGRS